MVTYIENVWQTLFLKKLIIKLTYWRTMKKVLKALVKLLNRFTKYKINITKKTQYFGEGTKINLGSGGYDIDGWINLDYDSDWYNTTQGEYITYDIRSDNIPFSSNSVDLVYCSHVIEHLEDNHIKRMFNEVFRVLKQGGIFRICCPDAKFLYEMTINFPEFWKWRENWFNGKNSINHDENPSNFDYLIREIATQKSRFYIHGQNILGKNEIEELKSKNYMEVMSSLTRNLTFRESYPGDHVNYWDNNKATDFLEASGFNLKDIIASKYRGSICEEMRSQIFDQTAPWMSLYMEARK